MHKAVKKEHHNSQRHEEARSHKQRYSMNENKQAKQGNTSNQTYTRMYTHKHTNTDLVRAVLGALPGALGVNVDVDERHLFDNLLVGRVEVGLVLVARWNGGMGEMRTYRRPPRGEYASKLESTNPNFATKQRVHAHARTHTARTEMLLGRHNGRGERRRLWQHGGQRLLLRINQRTRLGEDCRCGAEGGWRRDAEPAEGRRARQ